MYDSFIHNCQTLEAIKISFSGKWIKKPWYIQKMRHYSALEILITLKRNDLLRHERPGVSPNTYY